jgi:small subunit ribosomal protein S8
MNIKTINFLTQLKNASMINKESIKLESNRFILSVLKVLYKEGFILSYRVQEKKEFANKTSEVIVNIRYVQNKPVFNNLKIISSPSFQKLVSLKNISRLVAKKKFFLFSTNLGLLTLNECKKMHVGGFLLFVC